MASCLPRAVPQESSTTAASSPTRTGRELGGTQWRCAAAVPGIAQWEDRILGRLSATRGMPRDRTMEPADRRTACNREVRGHPRLVDLLRRVAKVIVVFWVVGFVVVLVGIKCWQEALLGPLQRAARDGDLPLVKSLIGQGTSVDEACDFKGWTALHFAAHRGHVAIAEFLLDQGANVSVRDKDGYTPLHNTADSSTKGRPPKRTEAERNRIAALLLKHGANVNATTNHGETPLHNAALPNNTGLVQLLLENGADPNIRQAQGMTPLHVAFFSGEDRAQIARLLLHYGADPSARDEYGHTPRDLAKEYHPQLLELFDQ